LKFRQNLSASRPPLSATGGSKFPSTIRLQSAVSDPI